MSPIRYSLCTVALAVVLSASGAMSQTSVSPPAAKPAAAAPAADASKPTAAAQVETWTRKQWEAAKKEWAKDKAKWADCRTQSNKQKLEGRKSWSFLYKCMTG